MKIVRITVIKVTNNVNFRIWIETDNLNLSVDFTKENKGATSRTSLMHIKTALIS